MRHVATVHTCTCTMAATRKRWNSILLDYGRAECAALDKRTDAAIRVLRAFCVARGFEPYFRKEPNPLDSVSLFRNDATSKALLDASLEHARVDDLRLRGYSVYFGNSVCGTTRLFVRSFVRSPTLEQWWIAAMEDKTRTTRSVVDHSDAGKMCTEDGQRKEHVIDPVVLVFAIYMPTQYVPVFAESIDALKEDKAANVVIRLKTKKLCLVDP